MDDETSKYPSPGALPSPWGYLLVASTVAAVPFWALGSPIGYVLVLPLVVWLIALVRRGRRMREKALTELETRAPTMGREEVDRHLASILRVYGGKPLPRVREHVARIRARADD